MKPIAVCALALAASCGVSSAAPVTFSIDPQHSRPRFAYNHFGFSTQLGSIHKMSGKIVLDTEAKSASVEATVDMNTLSSGLEVLDTHLKNADFFDVAKYPQAVFKSTTVVFDGDRPVSILGNLTLHGVTQPVTFTVTSFKHGPHNMLQNREALGGNAMAMVSRTAFGLGRFVPSVSDDVTITIGLEAIKD